MPFYSTEAWFLQATDKAIALCTTHHAAQHRESFEDWAKDRTRLDDEVKPKETNCLRDEHTHVLGEHVPVRDVVAANRSLAAFNRSLAAVPLIAASLRFESPAASDA